jgi:hypothetical protein
MCIPPDFCFSQRMRLAERLRLSAAGSPVYVTGFSTAAEKPVFMRVRENPPPLTLRLFAAFVNCKSRVSTGFLRFS